MSNTNTNNTNNNPLVQMECRGALLWEGSHMVFGTLHGLINFIIVIWCYSSFVDEGSSKLKRTGHQIKRCFIVIKYLFLESFENTGCR